MPRAANVRGQGEQLRGELVEAASALLLQPQPVALPSLRAVARACSVSPAAVYLHFSSSQALIQAVIAAQVDSLGHQMRTAVAVETDPAERLYAFARAYAEWGLSHPGAYQLLFETADRLPEASADHHQDDEDNWDLMHEAVDLIARATGSSGVAEQRAFRLWTGLHGIVSLRIHKRDASWPQDVAQDVRSAVEALLTPA